MRVHETRKGGLARCRAVIITCPLKNSEDPTWHPDLEYDSVEEAYEDFEMHLEIKNKENEIALSSETSVTRSDTYREMDPEAIRREYQEGLNGELQKESEENLREKYGPYYAYATLKRIPEGQTIDDVVLKDAISYIQKEEEKDKKNLLTERERNHIRGLEDRVMYLREDEAALLDSGDSFDSVSNHIQEEREKINAEWGEITAVTEKREQEKASLREEKAKRLFGDYYSRIPSYKEKLEAERMAFHQEELKKQEDKRRQKAEEENKRRAERSQIVREKRSATITPEMLSKATRISKDNLIEVNRIVAESNTEDKFKYYEVEISDSGGAYIGHKEVPDFTVHENGDQIVVSNSYENLTIDTNSPTKAKELREAIRGFISDSEDDFKYRDVFWDE